MGLPQRGIHVGFGVGKFKIGRVFIVPSYGISPADRFYSGTWFKISRSLSI
jgi:hypothetical protein